jgi:hypothetical protein
MNEEQGFQCAMCYEYYRELEANIVEEWVAYGSSRFVSTDGWHSYSAINTQYTGDTSFL